MLSLILSKKGKIIKSKTYYVFKRKVCISFKALVNSFELNSYLNCKTVCIKCKNDIPNPQISTVDAFLNTHYLHFFKPWQHATNALDKAKLLLSEEPSLKPSSEHTHPLAQTDDRPQTKAQSTATAQTATQQPAHIHWESLPQTAVHTVYAGFELLRCDLPMNKWSSILITHIWAQNYTWYSPHWVIYTFWSLTTSCHEKE